eukprot:TRINITY_DN3145_c0_g1_i1.p1 TRINITY_DN3145_c0_g1~~TRINITY_DN3145_c0_g1_i1.p1  ORF type:complete len:490 (-),score=120.48 TRINITY_DN3145_c0_g1_i1:219-1688(-)
MQKLLCICVLCLLSSAWARTNPGSGSDVDTAMQPRNKISLTGLSGDKKTMANIHNNRALYLNKKSAELLIRPPDAAAVLKVESGGSGFNSNGRMIIRFENHVFYSQFTNKGANAERVKFFKDHYQYNSDKSWTGHYWRRSTSDAWKSVHTNQDSEWEVLQFSQDQDDTAALSSASYGLAQIMGFNYASVGYASVQAMFLAYSKSITSQLDGLFAFIKSHSGCITGIRTQDYVKFATCYNGGGQASNYGTLISTASAAYAAVVPAFTLLKDDEVAFFTDVNIRSEAKSGASTVGQATIGDRGVILAGPVLVDGNQRYQIKMTTKPWTGWAAQGTNWFARIGTTVSSTSKTTSTASTVTIILIPTAAVSVVAVSYLIYRRKQQQLESDDKDNKNKEEESALNEPNTVALLPMGETNSSNEPKLPAHVPATAHSYITPFASPSLVTSPTNEVQTSESNYLHANYPAARPTAMPSSKKTANNDSSISTVDNKV